MVDDVIPVAPAAPAAPAAPEAPPAAPAAAPADPPSLVDPAPAAPAAPAEPASLVPEVTADPKWYLSEGVGGEGEAPDWFKADKYKTVDAQAQAYTALEQRFGAFTGAPEDGVYKINSPEGFQVEFDTENQMFQDLNKWSSESQLSQKAYDDLIGMFTRYEAGLLPDMGAMKKQLGDNADARLTSLSQWAKSNLTDDQYKAFRMSQTQNNAADVFVAMEAIVAKTRQVAMPKVGDDVPGAVPTGLEEINVLQAAKNEDGTRKYEMDQDYREMVEKKRIDYFNAQQPGQ